MVCRVCRARRCPNCFSYTARGRQLLTGKATHSYRPTAALRELHRLTRRRPDYANLDERRNAYLEEHGAPALTCTTAGILPATRRELADALADTAGRPHRKPCSMSKERKTKNPCEFPLHKGVLRQATRGGRAALAGRGLHSSRGKTTFRADALHSHWFTAPTGDMDGIISLLHRGRSRRAVNEGA